MIFGTLCPGWLPVPLRYPVSSITHDSPSISGSRLLTLLAALSLVACAGPAKTEYMSFTYIPVVNFLGEVAVLGLLVLTLFASAVCYLGVVAVLGMLIHALFVYASLMIQL